MRSLFFTSVVLLAVACGSKNDESDDDIVDVDGSSDTDGGDTDAVDTDGGDTDGGDTDGGDTDGGDTDGGDTDGGDTDGDEDGTADDTGPTDTGEEVIPDFDVDGVYEGTFTISLDVILVEDTPPLEDTCSGDVVFVVDESAETSITGTGSCAFSEDGALSGFVATGLVDSLGPFEGVTTGEVLTRPDASGTIAIDTSIGEISTIWNGVFAEAVGDTAASLNGSLDGSLAVDLSEVITGFGEVDVAYEGSFESVRTGDLPEDDTGAAPDTGLTDPSGGGDTSDGEASGDDGSVVGTTPGGGETGDTAGDAGGSGSTGSDDGGGGETATGGDDGDSSDDSPPIDPTGGPTPE